MDIEYKIKCSIPKDWDITGLLNHLPSPINRPTMTEIYNYRIEQDGFYFVDRLVDETIAALAFKLFLDEALRHGHPVQVMKL